MQADNPFQPFVPSTPDPPVVEKPISSTASRKRTRKNPRPPATAKPAIPPAPKHTRPTRKKTAKKRARLLPARRGTGLVVPPKPMPSARKERVVGKSPMLAAPYGKTRALKLDMYAAMAISALLKPTDFKLFERLTEALQSVNKATRRRVLGAIQKVFG